MYISNSGRGLVIPKSQCTFEIPAFPLTCCATHSATAHIPCRYGAF